MIKVEPKVHVRNRKKFENVEIVIVKVFTVELQFVDPLNQNQCCPSQNSTDQESGALPVYFCYAGNTIIHSHVLFPASRLCIIKHNTKFFYY